MFKAGERYTIYRIDSMMAMTRRSEITVKDFDPEGNPIYSLRGKRKRYLLRLQSRDYASAPVKPFRDAVFAGWDQPVLADTDQRTGVMRGNACYNFLGTPAEVRTWIDAGQLNPNFPREHALAIEGDAERAVYPEMETTHAVMNRVKGE